jgi:hypothetical protein
LCDLWPILQYFSPYFFLLCYYSRKGYLCIFWHLFGKLHALYMCHLQWEKYFLCSLHNILLFNTLSKLAWKLAWIWRHAALKRLVSLRQFKAFCLRILANLASVEFNDKLLDIYARGNLRDFRQFMKKSPIFPHG